MSWWQRLLRDTFHRLARHRLRQAWRQRGLRRIESLLDAARFLERAAEDRWQQTTWLVTEAGVVEVEA